jgi:hypothetical protein
MKSILQTGTSFDLPMRSRGTGKSPSNQVAQNAQNRSRRENPTTVDLDHISSFVYCMYDSLELLNL